MKGDRSGDLSAFVRAARAHAASRGSKDTRVLYEGDLDQWLAWCREHDHDPTKPSLHAASAFRDELLESCEPGTVRRKLSALSSMYETAMAEEQPLATWNPFRRRVARPPSDDYAVTEELSDDQVRQLIFEAECVAEHGNKGLRDAAVIEVLYGVGLRVSSTLKLQRDQVIVRDGHTYFGRVKVKKRGRVEVEVPERVAMSIQRWLAVAPASPHVFPSTESGERSLSRKTFDERLKVYGKAVGIKGAHAHRFRSSFATRAFDLGIPLHDVQAAMHHADPKTTQRYDRGVRGRGVADRVAEHRAKLEAKRSER